MEIELQRTLNVSVDGRNTCKLIYLLTYSLHENFTAESQATPLNVLVVNRSKLDAGRKKRKVINVIYNATLANVHQHCK